MGPGPFWIENRKFENHKKILLFDDYWFQKKKLDWVVGGFFVSSIRMLFGCLEFFNFATSLTRNADKHTDRWTDMQTDVTG